jgi:hypothetical protein
MTSHHEGSDVVRWDYSWLGKASVVLLAVAAVTFLWFQTRLPPVKAPSPLSEARPLAPQIEASPAAPPLVAPPLPVQRQTLSFIARATWSRNPETAREAIRLETERGEVVKTEIPRGQRKVLVALSQADGQRQAYLYYRATLLAAADKQLWQQTLRAPLFRISPHAHVLTVLLSSAPEIQAEPLVLRFEGKTQSDWQLLGEVTVERVGALNRK